MYIDSTCTVHACICVHVCLNFYSHHLTPSPPHPPTPSQLSARLLTHQHQVQTLRAAATDPLTIATTTHLHGDDDTDGGAPSQSSERLWEVIRYIRREKEIAVTRRELAESERLRHQQEARQLEQELREAREQLREISETAQLQTVTAAQHAEVLAKVRFRCHGDWCHGDWCCSDWCCSD